MQVIDQLWGFVWIAALGIGTVGPIGASNNRIMYKARPAAAKHYGSTDVDHDCLTCSTYMAQPPITIQVYRPSRLKLSRITTV
ncbi:hypothetical protein F4810DRAFT_678049 [Camillea tinctor]|nr:hypothetical protein F4810DRAFT_678049 [Camillea tinctor]